jgi:hydrogenase nickel incorporation protein HypA/HybF
MHEAAIIEDLIGAVEDELDRAGLRGRVRRLEVVVGRLSGASPEALRFAFQVLAPGTKVEGARLEISEPKALCRCAHCGARSETEDILGVCPACGSGDVTIEGARELLLQSVEVED